MHEAATALGHSFIESTDICDNFKTLKLLYILYHTSLCLFPQQWGISE